MIALGGGNEFRTLSREPDAALVALAGGAGARVAIVPAAAVDGARQAAAHGVRHFSALGARAGAVMIVDGASAADPALVARLDEADLVYLTGGNPWYLLETLRDSLALDALRRVARRGKVLAGSSAGAMVLADRMRRREGGWLDGLALVPGVAVIPHADEQGIKAGNAAARRAGLPSGITLVAIDTQTVLSGSGASWRNLGPGRVIVVPADGAAVAYPAGEAVTLSL